MPTVLIKRVHPASRLGVWECSEPIDELVRLACLSPAEMIRFREIHNERRRKQWLGCRIMLRNLLSGISGKLSLSYDENGKPFLPGDPRQISLSHSGTLAAAMVSPEHSAGVDVELVSSRPLRMLSRFLSPTEISLLTAITPETAAIAWCIKEAAFKLKGDPATDLIRDIQIDSFAYLCNGSGRSSLRLQVGKDPIRMTACFTVSSGCALAYVTAPVKL